MFIAMIEMDMISVDHNVKVGDDCGNKKANVTEDTLFLFEGKLVGFYIKKIEGKLKDLLTIANKEFRSSNVPKQDLTRSSRDFGRLDKGKKVVQYSTILGSVPPRTGRGRAYPVISSVHQHKTARTFIKSMMLLSREAEVLVKKNLPEIYLKQKEVIVENVPEKWRFSPLYTSSISNYNIAANFHRDTGNLKDTVNCIFTKRFDATGGYLNVPDYDVTVECADNSLLCYPAWRNVHGVTPIQICSSQGYRNSLIFYPLKGFDGY